ncbi:MAG TPA: hypothetical protein VE198_25815, partial [Actinoallomurus sp.]|nr:hypothetical protein [Actinoallomurus sp.]
MSVQDGVDTNVHHLESERGWDTRAGTVDLAIPKLRSAAHVPLDNPHAVAGLLQRLRTVGAVDEASAL